MDTLERAGVVQRAAPQRVTVAAQAASTDDGPARTRTAPLRRYLLLADAATVTLGLLAALVVRPTGALAPGHVALAALALPVWCVALASSRSAAPRPGGEGRRILQATLVSVAILLGTAAAVQFDDLSRGWVAVMALVVPSLVVAGRIAVRRAVGARTGRRVIIVGTDPEAIALVHAAQRRPELGLAPIGFVGPDDLGSRGGCDWLGDLDQFAAAVRRDRCRRRHRLARLGAARRRQPHRAVQLGAGYSRARWPPACATSTLAAAAPSTSTVAPCCTSSRLGATAGAVR